MPRLRYTANHGTRLLVRLDRLSPEVTIGRGRENTIWLDHPTVSRDHARIDYFRGRCTIYDRNSMNGIEVDGREVRKSVIAPGVLVRCGECEIEVLPDPEVDLNQGLSRLRALLHQEPSASVWSALTGVLVEWPDSPELSLALDYVVQHLDESAEWAAFSRAAPPQWRATLHNVIQRQPELEGDDARFMSRMTSCLLGPKDPRWRMIRRLDLRSRRMGPGGVRLLGRFPMLAELTSLVLGDNLLGDEGVEALLQSKHLHHLEELELWSNGIGDEGAQLLAGAWHLGELKKLGLGNNSIGRVGASALNASQALHNLTELHLVANPAAQFSGHAFGAGHRVRMSPGNLGLPEGGELPRHIREQLLAAASTRWPLREELLDECRALGVSALLVLSLSERALAVAGLRRGDSVVVGSGVDTTWRLVQEGLSPQHVRFEVVAAPYSEGAAIAFEDLDSRTGTFLQGRRVGAGLLDDYTFVELGAEWRLMAIRC